MQKKIPMWIHMIFLNITVLLFIPPALVVWARNHQSPNPRVHPIPDMDNQKHYKKQGANPAFLDKRSMRLPVAGTVAVGELRASDHLYRGKSGGDWAKTFPPELSVDAAFLDRGEQRYNIYCSVCHGYRGDGNGMVAKRAIQVNAMATGWNAPTNLHTAEPVTQPVGKLFNSITNGIRTMPAYGSQIPVEDRWAIVAYVRALQLSQDAR